MARSATMGAPFSTRNSAENSWLARGFVPPVGLLVRPDVEAAARGHRVASRDRAAGGQQEPGVDLGGCRGRRVLQQVEQLEAGDGRAFREVPRERGARRTRVAVPGVGAVVPRHRAIDADGARGQHAEAELRRRQTGLFVGDDRGALPGRQRQFRGWRRADAERVLDAYGLRVRIRIGQRNARRERQQRRAGGALGEVALGAAEDRVALRRRREFGQVREAVAVGVHPRRCSGFIRIQSVRRDPRAIAR